MAAFQDFWNKYFWDTSINTRSANISDVNARIDRWLLSDVLGGGKTAAGKAVTQDNALTFSAVWACTRILSGVISSLPFKIYERTSAGRRQAEDHPFRRITKYPNSYTTKAVYFQRAIIHYLNWGYHLAKINNGVQLELIHPSLLKKIEISTRNTLIFTIADDDGIEKEYPQSKIIYVPNLGDTLMGKGIITHAREDIGLEFAAQEYGEKWFAGGGKPHGLIHTDEKLGSEQIKDLKESYTKQKAQDGNLVLTHGFKYTPMSIPPEDAQFLGTRQFNVLTIARWYGVPPEKLAELDRATYGNLENNNLAFLADTVAPILSKFEQEYTLKLLDENRYYFEFDMDGYMRADTKTQAEVDRIYTAGGIRQINEVRKTKNWNPIEFGDHNFMQMNMTTLENIVNGSQLKKQDNGKLADEKN